MARSREISVVKTTGKNNFVENDNTDETNHFCPLREEICEETEPVVVYEDTDHDKSLVYNVSDNPPFHLLIVFAMQQCLLCIASPLSKAVIVSEIVCATQEESIKAHLLSATMLMTGLATFLMPTIGVRLPIFQGPASSYIIPLLSLQGLDEWKCPDVVAGIDPITNETVSYALIGNGTVVPTKELIFSKIQELSGSLVLAGFLHFLIGLTGFVGIIVRYVGPVTIVPTIVLMGLQMVSVVLKFSETCWLVAFITALASLILSVYMSNKKTPIPFWTRSRGLHIFWYPLHQVFAILISMLLGWALSALLTETGWLSDDPKSKNFFARTDTRVHVIEESNWFVLPYPGNFGPLSFNLGGFIAFFVATVLSILDSIGSKINQVVSRRVFQCAGIIFILFAVLGKVGAVFITIPYSVLGGITFIVTGLFIGVILSFLQTVNLNSERNILIMGMSVLLGLMLPSWMKKNPHAINIGNANGNSAIKMLLSNPSFIGGFFACVLDNTVHGTLHERGLLEQLKEVEASSDKEAPVIKYAEGTRFYRLPFLPNWIRKSRCLRVFPIFDTRIL
ncbi:solute carrier family 23 member 2 [Aplysia californica]|uniref:Solute carrier family 23 member 2 n=1 Tax=Aplysia californica TaxID=6500 RepID=A0ABM0JBK1_APLCA|nr:solute carrier family 23 member 2 [Aplysia californica]